MRIYLCAIFWACFNAPLALYAEEKCEWKTWADLGKSVIENSPEINVLKAEEQYRSSLLNTASLSPPAVANGQYTAGGLPWKSSSLEASYLWTIESKEKKEARLGAARAGAEGVKYDVEHRQASQLLKLALIQQTVRRLNARREVLLETRATYRKIVKQFENRLSLGPEQEASLAVFRIAKKENDLKIEALEVEKSQLSYELAMVTGCSQGKIPAEKTALGKELLLEEDTNSVSSAVRRLQAQSKTLKLSIDSEIQSYTPDLSIGPVVMANRSDDKNSLEVGIAASLPMGGERPRLLGVSKTAEYRARQTEIDLEISRMKIERDAWINQYQKSLKAMKGGLSKEEISKTHKKLESLFQGERVSAALVIEAHRQLLDHITTFTELETKASEAIWNIRYLDGKLKWSDL
jgi:outer membrane protein TolC